MAQLSQLIPTVVGIPEIRMSTMGHLLWICWQKTLPAAIDQTLENYGGMQIYVHEEQRQAIWFFFTEDVFLVLARLIIWGNFNELPVCVELFPGRLQVDRKGEISILLDASLQNQEILVPDKLEVWVHYKSCENHKILPGIEFIDKRPRRGMAKVNWMTPVVDMRMPFSSTQSWIIILHPLGSPLDKAFIDGWYAMYKRLTELFQQHKIKSISENYFVILLMENLLMLRGFMRDYLALIKGMDTAGTSWPCVTAIVDRGNLNFSGELPQKVNLHWARLVAGFPYISYRNAYLLGKGFLVRDLHFSGDQMTMDEWCNIQLVDNDSKKEAISLLMPGKLTETIDGSTECFFCGLSSHTTFDCPTLHLPRMEEDVWTNVGTVDLVTMKKSFQEIETCLEKKGLEGYQVLLDMDNKVTVIIEAIFDIIKYAQLRNIEHYWLYRMKEPDPDERKNVRDDNSYAWDLLEHLLHSKPKDYYQIFKQITELVEEHTRDPRLHTLAGFAAIFRKDFEAAIRLFSRAAMLTANVPLEGWNEFLVARTYEVLGHFGDAIRHYTKVSHILPESIECRYRAIVCRVKMGFVEQILDEILALIKEDPGIFNRFLIDPGLDRGRILVLTTLHDVWQSAEEQANQEQSKIHNMRIKFDDWFKDPHPFRKIYEPKLSYIEKLATIKNYMAFLKLIDVRPELEEELNINVEKEIDDLRQRYKNYLNALQIVRDEFSWFPFPAALKEFGQEFNEAASILNWAYSSNFKQVDVFRQATQALDQLDRLLRGLKRRLHSLRIVRDGTLFTMTMGKTFFVTEIVGLILCIAFILVVGFFGDSIHLGWLKGLITANKVSILEVLVVVISVISLGISALRTTIIFDRCKDKLVENAKMNREKDQQARLDKIKHDKILKAEADKRAEEEERQAEMRRNLRERLEQ